MFKQNDYSGQITPPNLINISLLLPLLSIHHPFHNHGHPAR